MYAIRSYYAIVEFQFLDFIGAAFDIITNYAATTRYRTGNAVPIVMRGPMGGGVRGGPFPSQNPESRITSYNVCYTKLLRAAPQAGSR